MPGSGDRGSGFFGVVPIHCSDMCNFGRGFLESPVVRGHLVIFGEALAMVDCPARACRLPFPVGSSCLNTNEFRNTHGPHYMLFHLIKCIHSLMYEYKKFQNI